MRMEPKFKIHRDIMIHDWIEILHEGRRYFVCIETLLDLYKKQEKEIPHVTH